MCKNKMNDGASETLIKEIVLYATDISPLLNFDLWCEVAAIPPLPLFHYAAFFFCIDAWAKFEYIVPKSDLRICLPK